MTWANAVAAMHGSVEVLVRMLTVGGALLQLSAEAVDCMVLAGEIALDLLRGCFRLLAWANALACLMRVL